MRKVFQILGLCGSLRANSSNGVLLKTAQDILKNDRWVTFDLATLPYFDPDRQYAPDLPETVRNLRAAGNASDLIFIATPEYTHGVPGILKNGLEWLFNEGTQKKPVALVVGAAQGEYARDQLVEVLSTMDFSIGKDDTLIIKGARSKIQHDVLADPPTYKQLETFCLKFT